MHSIPGIQDNRRTIVHTISDSIFGIYQLLDLLDLKTTSGSIEASVSPQAAGKDGPAQAAVFKAHTVSGNIRVGLDRMSPVPVREYITQVSSLSGTISGTYLMGSRASFGTISGSMNLVLSPAAYGRDPPSVFSKTVSGSQEIVVLASEDKTALQTLTLGSDSKSGSVIVRCSGDFEGTIRAGTLTGNIFVMGPGVEIVKTIPHSGGKYVEATKGNGAGMIRVNTVSGDVRIFIG